MIAAAFSGPRRWLAWTAAAAPLYAVSCVIAEGGLATTKPWGDVGQYERYGRLVLDGSIPYHDFYLEYPPGALPVFILPATITSGHSHYLWVFKLLMAICGLLALALVARMLDALGADNRRIAVALAAFVAAPVALGHIFLNRYDAWPALLSVVVLSTLLARRVRVSSGALALDFAAKVFAVAIAPVVATRLWRTEGARGLRSGVVSFVVVSVAVFSTFLVFAFGGLGNSYYTQLKRALQIESMAASLLLALDRLGLHHVAVTTSSPGSIDLGGRLPDALGVLTSLVQLGAIVLVAVLYWRGPETKERLVTAFAAAVAAFALFGKVLSPQYLIWLAPFIPLVRGSRGAVAGVLLFLALGLTQTWFPWHYWSLANHHASPWSWYLLARDLALVALAGVLVLALSRERDSGAGRGDWRVARRAAA